VQLLRFLVTVPSSQIWGFDSGPTHLWFVFDNNGIRTGFLWVIPFYCDSIIPPVLHNHSHLVTSVRLCKRPKAGSLRIQQCCTRNWKHRKEWYFQMHAVKNTENGLSTYFVESSALSYIMFWNLYFNKTTISCRDQLHILQYTLIQSRTVQVLLGYKYGLI